jgi:hypothetical protein
MTFRPTSDTSGGGSTGFGSTAPSGGATSSGGGSTSSSSTAPAVVPNPGTGATAKQNFGLYQIVRGTLDRSEYGPPIDVPPGAVVSIAPIPSNLVNCFFSTMGFEAAKGGPRIALAPTGNPRTVKVRNLREIGVYSANVGEGVTIDIQEG